MIVDNKEKWVIDRLKRLNGYSDRFGSYSDEECLLWKPRVRINGFDWSDTYIFYINRRTGIRIEFRPNQMESLHLIKYFPWPTIKNWHEIEEYERFVREKALTCFQT
jgi:hypothetical protein